MLGTKLKNLRKENKYTIKNIISKLNEYNICVTEKSIYRWENNKVVPDIKTIHVLSNIFNVSLTSLYEDSKYCKALNKSESKFLNYLRTNSHFKKIVSLLIKLKGDNKLWKIQFLSD